MLDFRVIETNFGKICFSFDMSRLHFAAKLMLLSVNRSEYCILG